MSDISKKIRERLEISRQLGDPDTRRALRESAGLSQQELATVIGASRQSISQWESGLRSPRGTMRDRYAEALKALAHPNRTEIRWDKT